MGVTQGISPDADPDAKGSGAGTHRYDPGDTVVLRELWRDRVWYARPAIVVADRPNLRMFYVPPSVVSLVPVDEQGRALRLYADDWSLVEESRGASGFLSFAFPDTPYAIILGYGSEGHLFEYYVNLQSPLRPSAIGFDTTEHLLDVEIPADRTTWRWKDEDELQDAVELGLFTDHDVAWFRFWGERAVEHVLLREPPFDRDWDVWRPEPSWPTPALPDRDTVTTV